MKSINLKIRGIISRLFFGGIGGLAKNRRKVGKRWVTGRGIEIGALQHPLKVSNSVHATYVDRMATNDLITHYPELSDKTLTPVDVIDDGERLVSFEDKSQDFVVANHLLEHCENPIGALTSWLRVLKPAGIIYMAVPEKTFTFDFRRPITTWQHLLDDYENGPDQSRYDHYKEWSGKVLLKTPTKISIAANELMNAHYSIHFHVWTYKSLQAFLIHCIHDMNLPFSIVDYLRNGPEVITVLRKL